jgi:hypothetical protein
MRIILILLYILNRNSRAETLEYRYYKSFSPVKACGAFPVININIKTIRNKFL